MLRLWACGWLLLTFTHFLRSSGASKINPWDTEIHNLDAAMKGYDPVMSNPLSSEPDPGVRNQIFDPKIQLPDKSFVLNSFVLTVRESLHCDSKMTSKTLRNYNEYKREKSSAYKFSADAAKTIVGGFSFEAFAGYGIEEDKEQPSVRSFFQDTNGEIILNKILCITHEIEIDPSEEPVFTPSFLTALKHLNFASKNPNSAFSKSTFVEFVKTFGTHFIKKTLLGAKLVFEKRFTNKEVKNSSGSSRSQCVADSVQERQGDIYGGLSASSSSASSSKICEDSSHNSDYFRQNGISSETVVSIGSLPMTELKKWASIVKDSPVPVYFELDKISNLFHFPWFSTIPLDDQGDQTEFLNGIAMYDFFEEHSADYCSLVLGKTCSTEEKGCGLNSDCSPRLNCINDPNSSLGYKCVVQNHCEPNNDCPFGSNCINDPNSSQGYKCVVQNHCEPNNDCPSGSTCTDDADSLLGYKCVVKYGGVIIAGGIDDDSNTLSGVEALDTWQPPSLPYAVSTPALSVVGSKLYACGGYKSPGGGIETCYKLDRSSSSPTWTSLTSLPTPMYQHSSAVVTNHIWYTFDNQLFDLDTNNDNFRTYNLPFYVDSGHCAISNLTHSYVTGAGREDNQIWVNTVASSPEKWHQVATMDNGRWGHGCLWLDGNVYITGGLQGHSYRSDVEVFNTDTLLYWKTGSLEYNRVYHKMMVLDGKPAVVGGEKTNNNELDTIETYDIVAGRWETSSRKLRTKRALFGLAQLHE